MQIANIYLTTLLKTALSKHILGYMHLKHLQTLLYTFSFLNYDNGE